MLAIFAGPTNLRSGITIPEGAVLHGGFIDCLETWYEPADRKDQLYLSERDQDPWEQWNIEGGYVLRVQNDMEQHRELEDAEGCIWIRQRMRLTDRLRNGPFTDAGAIQRQIESVVGPLEHRPFVQESRDGLNILGLSHEDALQRMVRVGHIEERMARSFLAMGIDPYVEEPLARYCNGRVRTFKHERIHVSPSLRNEQTGMPLTLGDFPPNWAFGNGCTANSNVIRLRDGTYRILSWVVTDYKYEDSWRDLDRLEQLRIVVEHPMNA